MALLVAAQFCLGDAAAADEVAATYHATWAGIPAGDIRMSFRQDGSDYRNRIEIASRGLPRWLTKFWADATGEGRIAADGAATPSRYDARYDLRKRRDSRIDLRYVEQDGAVIAERGAEDTSHKPPLAAPFRRNTLDPLSALAAVRNELKARRGAGGPFVVPVFDGARRFDVAVTLISSDKKDRLIRLRLTLHPVAGFKGESSEDGDPDSAPRPVDVAFSDDSALVPVSLRVSIAFLPLEVRLDKRCDSFETCPSGAR